MDNPVGAQPAIRLTYYPGCTLRSKALAFDTSAKAAAAALGIEFAELADFTCCGALYPQTAENLMGLLAPARTLVQAQRASGNGRLLTLCSFCYNTLKRANRTLRDDETKRATLAEYLEEPYAAGVEVVHLLEVLRDDVGYERIKASVRRDLSGLRVAPYYGCLLLRPGEIGLDDAEDPTVLEDVLRALGCEVVDFPMRTECCGSYLIVSNPSLAHECSRRVLEAAERLGADALVTSCPLCHFNLTRCGAQRPAPQEGEAVPVLYFTQLLGLALGVSEDSLGVRLGDLGARPR